MNLLGNTNTEIKEPQAAYTHWLWDVTIVISKSVGQNPGSFPSTSHPRNFSLEHCMYPNKRQPCILHDSLAYSSIPRKIFRQNMFKFVCDYKEGIRMLEYDIIAIYPNILITSYFVSFMSKPFPRHHLFRQLYFMWFSQIKVPHYTHTHTHIYTNSKHLLLTSLWTSLPTVSVNYKMFITYSFMMTVTHIGYVLCLHTLIHLHLFLGQPVFESHHLEAQKGNFRINQIG